MNLILSIAGYGLILAAVLGILTHHIEIAPLPPAPWKQCLKDCLRIAVRTGAITVALMIIFIPTVHFVWRLFRGGK